MLGKVPAAIGHWKGGGWKKCKDKDKTETNMQ